MLPSNKYFEEIMRDNIVVGLFSSTSDTNKDIMRPAASDAAQFGTTATLEYKQRIVDVMAQRLAARFICVHSVLHPSTLMHSTNRAMDAVETDEK